MSDLIISWLNDEVQLTKKIYNFEEDFANGFFFGELLSKYNQQLNFSEFENKDIQKAKLNNFALLQPTFNTLGVRLDSQIADDILRQKAGVALTTLYQLKMALEKVNNPADVLLFKNGSSRYSTVTPLKTIKPPKDQYDAFQSRFFEKRLQEMNKPQKEINLDQSLKKFEQFEQRQDEKIRRMKEKDEQDLNNLKAEVRKMELYKLQRNMAFMEDWHEKGQQQWKKNLDIGKKRAESEQTFKQNLDEKQKNRIKQMQDLTRKDVLEGIDAFEKNLQKQGIKRDSDDELGDRKTEGGAGGSTTKFNIAATMSSGKSKEKKLLSDWQRKERDKRRRKMIVDQSKIQREIEVQKREQLVLQKLKQQSRQEKEIEYEIWRAQQCMEIISQNRELRDERYRQMHEMTVVNAKYKEEEMLSELKAENQVDIQQKLFRQNEIQIAHKQSQRRVNYEESEVLVEQLIALADICYKHQQDADTETIDEHFWNDQLKAFVEGKPLLETVQFRTTEVVANLKKQSESNLETKSFLAERELEDFIEGRGVWTPHHHKEVDEQQEVVVPDRPLNNTLLGNLVSNILSETHAEDIALINSKLLTNPDFLAIKCVLLGYQFSGKKSISECLGKKYGVELLLVDNLINDLISRLQLAAEDEDDSDLQLARVVQDVLISGQNIPDELYVRIIMNKLNQLHPRPSEDQFLELYNSTGSTNRPLNQKRKLVDNEDSLPLTKEDLFKESLENSEFKYTKGWILIDFPSTYNQAKLLEKELSGFKPSDEYSLTQLEKKLKNAYFIAKPDETQIIPRKLLRGGVDYAIYLNISKEESLRRCLGRRYDPNTNSIFHLEDNPPPVDNAPLIERVSQIRDYETQELAIVDKNCFLDLNKDDLQQWFNLFGFYKEVKSVRVVKRKVERIVLEKVEGEEQEQQKQVQYEEEVEEEYSEYLPVASWQEVESNQQIDNLFYRVDEHIQNLLEFKHAQYQKLVEKKQQQELKIKQDEEEERIRKENEHKLLLVDHHDIQKQIQQLNAAPKLNQEAVQNLATFWNRIEEQYLHGMNGSFQRLKEQREIVRVRLAETQRRFLELLQRQDNKFQHVRDYQEKYNHFLSTQPDMCEEDATKEELHQRVEDLHDLLFDIIEGKKEDALKEKQFIQEAQFIETEMEKFLSIVKTILQTELSRSFGCQQIIQDYYSYLAKVDLVEVPELYKTDLQLDAATPLEENEAFPRLEKLFEAVLRLFTGEEEVEDKGKKGGKGAKKEDKKAAKKGGKQEEEVVRQLTPLELEMKEAVKQEKSIFRYRLAVIKDVAVQTLKGLRHSANDLQVKLQDWINYTVLVENQAVDKLVMIFRDAIESQQKLQKEIQLNYVDIVISHQTLNFLTPPPIILPAHELEKPDRFTISQLFLIIEELKSLQNDATGNIEIVTLLQLINRKIINQISAVEFPPQWRKLTLTDWQRVINSLNVKKNGYINCRDLCTYLCLLDVPVIDRIQAQNLSDLLIARSDDGNRITKEKLITTQMWLDQYQAQDQEINTNIFDRVRFIKDLIFYIHAAQEQKHINVQQLLDTFTAKVYLQNVKRAKNQQFTYNDLLLGTSSN